MAIGNLLTRLIAQIEKRETENNLFTHYAPPSLDDVLHDGLVGSGKTLGGILGATAGYLGGQTVGGSRGALAGSALLEPMGALAGAWATHGAYREGQLINDIITHPENWTVDAAGAIVPVSRDPASSSSANEPDDASSQSSAPSRGDVGTASSGEPPTRILASRRLNSSGEPTTPWRFPAAVLR